MVMVDEEEQEIFVLLSFTPPRRRCSSSLRRLIIPSFCQRIFFWPLPARDRVPEILIAQVVPFSREVGFVQEFLYGLAPAFGANILATEQDAHTRSRRGIYYLARARQSRLGNRILLAIFGTVSAPLATRLRV